MFNNQNSHQCSRLSQRFSSSTSLPTFNQVIWSLKKETPAFNQISMLCKQEKSKSKFQLSPKQSSNFINEKLYKSLNPFSNKISLGIANQAGGKQQNNWLTKFKGTIQEEQKVSKQQVQQIFPSQRRNHQRVQSAQQIKQVAFLKADNKRMHQLNQHLKGQLKTIKAKLSSCEKLLLEHINVIEQKQEIIRKMSSFNDELCLKIIHLQNLLSLEKSKQNFQKIQDVVGHMHDSNQNSKIDYQKTVKRNLLDSHMFKQQTLLNKLNSLKEHNKKVVKHCQQNLLKQQIKIELEQKDLKFAKEQNPQESYQVKHSMNSNNPDFMLSLTEKVEKFWSLYAKNNNSEQLNSFLKF